MTSVEIRSTMTVIVRDAPTAAHGRLHGGCTEPGTPRAHARAPRTLLVLVLTVWTSWPGQPHTPKLGLDLRGGTQVILTPQVTEGEADSITQEQLDQTVNIIRQRIDGFGVAEAEVTTQGSGANSAVVVSVPGELSQEQPGRHRLDGQAGLPRRCWPPPEVPTTAPSASPTPNPPPPARRARSREVRQASPKASGNGAAVTGGLLPAADPTASPGATTAAREPDRIGQPLSRPDGQRAAAADPEQDQRRGAAGEVRRARLHREGRAHRRPKPRRPEAVHGDLPDRRDGEVPAGAGRGARHRV